MKTNSPIIFGSGDGASFEISGIERFDDGSGYRGSLSLTSGQFGCKHYDFYFDNLEHFAKDIQKMYDSLNGKARLKHTYEHDYIELEMRTRGHLTVTGLLTQQSNHSQELKFSFSVDQSYLPPLISSTELLLQSLKL